MLRVVEVYRSGVFARLELPLFLFRVRAGFPSPADDYTEEVVDLNKRLVQKPSATFILKVEGESMIKAGIFPGDLIIVDRSLTPKPGNIVVVSINGDFTVKRYRKRDGKAYLVAENPAFEPIPLDDNMQVEMFGVVKNSIHNLL